jgi:hypothetical protein
MLVILAKAGIQWDSRAVERWIPACAGMTMIPDLRITPTAVPRASGNLIALARSKVHAA